MGSSLQRWSFGLAAVVFALGPATGAERALHLAAAAERHNAHNCSICQELTIGSHADQVSVPAVATWEDPPPTRIGAASDRAPVLVNACQPLIPRAPPA